MSLTHWLIYRKKDTRTASDSDTFLYGFIVPILSYMLEDRLHVDPSQTQSLTSAILAIHGVVAIVTAPIVGHFADQSPSRKLPLLLSLAACIVGTVLVACAPSLWLLFLGRVLQGIAGSAVWIVALATVADTVGEEHMGKVMGLVDSFVTAGIIAGPVVSGLFLQVWGYWGTWAAPLVVLTLDIIARLVMIENPEKPKPSSTSSSGDDESASASLSAANPDENRALLADDDAPNSTMYQSTSTAILDQSKKQDDLSTSLAFYRAMLTNSRAMTALLISIASSSVMTSFDATIPLHVRDMFGWGPSTTSMMFLSLEAPTILTGPLSGWLRNQSGIRIPATLSLVVLAPLMWLLGVPGDEHFPWASADTAGLPIYISSLICIGAVAPFLSGVGILELTGESGPTSSEPAHVPLAG